ncbi:MAG: glutathione S-transferase family protein [Cyanobacteria bacterium P01_F01_bin.53]
MPPSFFLKETTVLLLAVLAIPTPAIAQDGSHHLRPHAAAQVQLAQTDLPQGEAVLQLYGGPRTRTPLVQWYLEELDVPYEYVSLDLQAEEHRQPDYLAINPIGKVPVIVDGDFNLWESGAILLYLADKHGAMPAALEDRALINQWVIFANATLGRELFREEQRPQELSRLLTPINDVLSQQPFMLGSELTAADVAVGSYLYYATFLTSLDLADYPAIASYLDRLAERPAFINTIGQR